MNKPTRCRYNRTFQPPTLQANERLKPSGGDDLRVSDDEQPASGLLRETQQQPVNTPDSRVCSLRLGFPLGCRASLLRGEFRCAGCCLLFAGGWLLVSGGSWTLCWFYGRWFHTRPTEDLFLRSFCEILTDVEGSVGEHQVLPTRPRPQKPKYTTCSLPNTCTQTTCFLSDSADKTNTDVLEKPVCSELSSSHSFGAAYETH